MSELLRDVLDIPEQAGAEDYVLRLTDSIEPAAIARLVEVVTGEASAQPSDAGAWFAPGFEERSQRHGEQRRDAGRHGDIDMPSFAACVPCVQRQQHAATTEVSVGVASRVARGKFRMLAPRRIEPHMLGCPT